MRRYLVRTIAGFGAGLALLAGAAAVSAADLALIASGGEDGARPGLAEQLIDAYSDAGYEVVDGRAADRRYLLGLLEDFEFKATNANRLVIHLIGPLSESGGLTMFMPSGSSPSSITDIMAEGLPLQLFLDLVDQGAGRGMLALGITNFRKQPADGLMAPPGVLLIRGYPRAVNTVVVDQMLRNGRSAGEIDTRTLSVEVEGYAFVKNSLELAMTLRLTGARERTPAEREDELNLSRDERLQIQKDLRLLGYEPGAADGVFGRTTREAIRDWQAGNGFPETSYLTADQAQEIARAAESTRDELRAATSALRGERADWEAAQQEDTMDAYRAFLDKHPEGRFAEAARDKIAELEEKIAQARRLIAYRGTEDALELNLASAAVVERRLERLGYDAGPADGRFDRQTRRALAAFQEKRGLEASGYVDVPTLQQLIIAGAEE